MHRMLVHRRLEVFADHLRRPAEEAIRMRIMVAHMVLCGPIWPAKTVRLPSTGSNEIQQLRWKSSLSRVAH
jgi:transposase